MLNAIIRFFGKQAGCLDSAAVFTGWGIVSAPFDFNVNWLPRDPVAVDAIPDIGENQQIVFTRWMGRSPQDVETRFLPAHLSLAGHSRGEPSGATPCLVLHHLHHFQEEVEFYWSRSRILEKLNSLPANLLPDGVQPALVPDATALGQIYWYTLEVKGS